MVQKDLNEKGYNKEEEYFHELNKKLMEKKKKELAEKEKEPKKEKIPQKPD